MHLARGVKSMIFGDRLWYFLEYLEKNDHAKQNNFQACIESWHWNWTRMPERSKTIHAPERPSVHSLLLFANLFVCQVFIDYLGETLGTLAFEVFLSVTPT